MYSQNRAVKLGKESRGCALIMSLKSDRKETEAPPLKSLARSQADSWLTRGGGGVGGKLLKASSLPAALLHAYDEVLPEEAQPGLSLPISPKVTSRARARTYFGKSCCRSCQGKADLVAHTMVRRLQHPWEAGSIILGALTCLGCQGWNLHSSRTCC